MNRASSSSAGPPGDAEARPAEAVAVAAPVRRGRILSQAAWFTVTLYFSVGVGAALGGTLRALCSLAAGALIGGAFPWGTLFVNVVGSFVIGFVSTLSEPGGRLFIGPRRRHFVITGLCGGFTTFSVFSLETLRLLQDGNPALAAVSVAASVITWLGAVWLGHILALRLNRLGGT